MSTFSPGQVSVPPLSGRGMPHLRNHQLLAPLGHALTYIARRNRSALLFDVRPALARRRSTACWFVRQSYVMFLPRCQHRACIWTVMVDTAQQTERSDIAYNE